MDLSIAKLTYVALNFAGLLMALYKCRSLGLLPIASSDWISLLSVKIPVEASGGGVAL